MADLIKSEVKCKMSRNEKKGTRRKAYAAQKVVRRSPPCRTGDDGLGQCINKSNKIVHCRPLMMDLIQRLPRLIYALIWCPFDEESIPRHLLNLLLHRDNHILHQHIMRAKPPDFSQEDCLKKKLASTKSIMCLV